MFIFILCALLFSNLNILYY